MQESTKNNKTVFSFRVRDSKAAWQVAQKYMNDKYFRPHEEFRDLYYTTAPGLGMQYLQFFKTEEEIQVVTFLGGPVHPVPLSEIQPQTAQSVRVALKGMLEPLRQMEMQEAQMQPVQPAAETPAEPANVQTPMPTEIPATPDAGFVAGTAPTAQPTANETITAAPASTMPDDQPAAAPDEAQSAAQGTQYATFGYGASTQSRALPQDPAGTRYPYDTVNGGPNDRASNAVAGLVLGIIGLFAALLGMALPGLGILGLIPLTLGLILSVNGRRSRRRGIATAGMVICLVAIAIVIFVSLVWLDIIYK